MTEIFILFEETPAQESIMMNTTQSNLILHHSSYVDISVSPEQLFDFLNNPYNLSSHMSKSSLMMMGSKMKIETDIEKGQKLGSEIRLTGKFLGINIFVKESVVELEKPFKKAWQTQGEQKLIIIEQYKMGFIITPTNKSSHLEVYIDYTLPQSGISSVLGKLFGHLYAKWCAEKMTQDAYDHFK